jgi:outer membrane protein assembly factor BamB
MYADSATTPATQELSEGDQGTYIVSETAGNTVIGTNMSVLQAAGIDTDARLFVMTSDSLSLADVRSARIGTSTIQCSTPLHISIQRGRGYLVVEDGASPVCKTEGMQITGAGKHLSAESGSLELDPGHYALRFPALPINLRAQVKRFQSSEHDSKMAHDAANYREFGVQASQMISTKATITSFSEDGANLIYGDVTGSVYQLAGTKSDIIGQLPSARPVTMLRTADLRNDGTREIIAADDDENLFVLGPNGRLLWQRKLSGYRFKANVTDITIADLGKQGKTILAATASWVLFAFDADGNMRWKTTTKYHEETKVRVLERADKEKYIAVGTEYQTPLNVLSASGSLLWYTWEEMGNEFLASTPYSGFGLTAMVTLDTDNDGKQEVIFGTKANTIYAMDIANGTPKWQANVGDEVTAIETLGGKHTGENSLLVATAAGEIFEYDRTGRRLQQHDFGSGIIDLHVVRYKDRQRSDIVLTLQGGSVIVCDNTFRVRATFHTGGGQPLGTALGQSSETQTILYEVLPDSIRTAAYLPYFLKPSRDY